MKLQNFSPRSHNQFPNFSRYTRAKDVRQKTKRKEFWCVLIFRLDSAAGMSMYLTDVPEGGVATCCVVEISCVTLIPLPLTTSKLNSSFRRPFFPHTTNVLLLGNVGSGAVGAMSGLVGKVSYPSRASTISTCGLFRLEFRDAISCPKRENIVVTEAMITAVAASIVCQKNIQTVSVVC